MSSRTPKTDLGRLTDTRDDAIFTRLIYIGLAHLNLSLDEAGFMIFGRLLDLIDCWRIETGRATEGRTYFRGQ